MRPGHDVVAPDLISQDDGQPLLILTPPLAPFSRTTSKLAGFIYWKGESTERRMPYFVLP